MIDKLKSLFIKLLEFFGIIKKTDNSSEVEKTTEDTTEVVPSTEEEKNTTDVTIEVNQPDEDDTWYEYTVFDETTIELIKTVFRPIIKNYYSGEDQSVYFEFMNGLVKRIKVYCTISEDGKLLSIRFTSSDDYNKLLQDFITKFILKDFYDKIANTALDDLPLEIKVENGIVNIKLVKFLNDEE